MQTTQLPAEHVLTVRFRTSVESSADTPGGTRVIVNVTGGEFTGARLRGNATAGADWALRRPDGTVQLDVRAHLRTDDDVSILMKYEGVGVADPARITRAVAAARFEAPVSSPYAWLNDEVCVAMGITGPGSVEYQVYALRWTASPAE